MAERSSDGPAGGISQQVSPTVFRALGLLLRRFEALSTNDKVSLRLLVLPQYVPSNNHPHSYAGRDPRWVFLGGGLASIEVLLEVVKVGGKACVTTYGVSVHIGIESLRSEAELQEILSNPRHTIEVQGDNYGTNAIHDNYYCGETFPSASWLLPIADEAVKLGIHAGDLLKSVELSSLGIGPTDGISGLARWLSLIYLLQSDGVIPFVGSTTTVDAEQVHEKLQALQPRSSDDDVPRQLGTHDAFPCHRGFSYIVDDFILASELALTALCEEEARSVDPGKYPAGEDAYRRDELIYERAIQGCTNAEIVEEIDRLAHERGWEPIGEDSIRRRLTEYCGFTGLPKPERRGRPRKNRTP
ncbi:MAG: hypothetical protein KatS3mg111_0301 [Pirellulaceae bacterium]|nr:MAG: hypothetical protein KatS3mg111_0301 [Pirellulaceae bacterium]